MSNGSASQDAVASPVCFGKVPTYGDFLRYNAGGSTVRSLERWFQEGLYNLKARIKHYSNGAYDSLNGAYDRTPTLRFVFCPTASSNLLVGALRMSRDEGGRRYPFVVAAEVDKNRMRPQRAALLPFCDAAFLEEASGLVEEAASGATDRETLAKRLEALEPPGAGICEGGALQGGSTAAEARLEQAFRETSFRTLVERIWGDFEDSRKYLVLRNLLASLGPVRRSIPARFSLGLRFPLSRTEAAAQESVFWIKLSLRILDSRNVTPTFFWNTAAGDGDSANRLLLFFRPPPPRAFTNLLPLSLESDHICELERSGREEAARVVLSLPDHYGRLLESETVTLWEFLSHF